MNRPFFSNKRSNRITFSGDEKAMTNSAKGKVVRPNRGSVLRPRAKSPRSHFLYVDVTKEEQEKIHDYCINQQVSVSQFLADIMMQDALKAKANPKRREKVIVQA